MALEGPAEVSEPLGSIEGHGSEAREICVKFWQPLTVLGGFWLVLTDLAMHPDHLA